MGLIAVALVGAFMREDTEADNVQLGNLLLAGAVVAIAAKA